MKSDRVEIIWTPEMLERFIRSYRSAVADNLDTFTFDGNEFVREYAKYLIKYLDMTFALGIAE